MRADLKPSEDPPVRVAGAAPPTSTVHVWFVGARPCLLRADELNPERISGVVDGPVRPDRRERGAVYLSDGTDTLGPLDAEVAALTASGDGALVTLALEDVPLQAGLTLARYARSWATARDHAGAFREVLDDPRDVDAALRLLVEQGRRGRVALPGGQHVPIEPRDHDPATGASLWSVAGSIPHHAPFLIEAEGYNAALRLAVMEATPSGELLRVMRPAWVERIRRRREHRVAAPEGCCVAFDHPLWPQVRVERRLLDLGHSGLAFEGCATADCVYPGLELPTLHVLLEPDTCVRLRGRVASYRRGAGSLTAAFGCQVSPATPRDAERWARASEVLRFPTTRRGAAEVWEVYRDSGYFGLSETLEGDFEHLRAPYLEGARKLSAAPTLGCQARWPASGPAAATLTNLRLHSETWFSFHLAAKAGRDLSGSSAQVLRDLYRQYLEHTLVQPAGRWQMAYVQHSAHWSMRVHVDIPRRYQARGEGLVWDFRALAVRALGPRLAAPARSFRVDEADAAQREACAARLGERRPEVYCDALDYTPARFDMPALRAQWQRAGLERERGCLVAVSPEGAPLACAVLECAEPGLHLFGLLDTARLYALDTGGEETFAALLDGARAWFRARGRRSFCYLEEEGRMPPDGALLKELSPAYLTILSVERLPEMLEYIHADTA